MLLALASCHTARAVIFIVRAPAPYMRACADADVRNPPAKRESLGPTLCPHQPDLIRLARQYNATRPDAVRAVARELNTSSAVVRHWLHHLGQPLPEAELERAKMDNLLLWRVQEAMRLEQPPSRASIAEEARLSIGGMKYRLRNLLEHAQRCRAASQSRAHTNE